MENYTDKLIEYYTKKDDLKKVCKELRAKYPNQTILYRGWGTFGNRGGDTKLQFPTEDEKILHRSHAGLFFTGEIDYALEYGDTIKAYLLDKTSKIFNYKDSATEFIENEHPELLDYSDNTLDFIIHSEDFSVRDSIHTWNDTLEYYKDDSWDRLLHISEYLAWLVLKDKYDGVYWGKVPYCNYYEEEWQIWNLDKLKEIE